MKEKITKGFFSIGMILIAVGIATFIVKEKARIEAAKTPRDILEEEGFTIDEGSVGYVARYGDFSLEVTTIEGAGSARNYKLNAEIKEQECDGALYSTIEHKSCCYAYDENGDLEATMCHFIYAKPSGLYIGSLDDDAKDWKKVDKVMKKIWKNKN